MAIAIFGRLLHQRRFDQPYATDHAKYLVVNPGIAHAVAILGSPNGTTSAFTGWNAEDAPRHDLPRYHRGFDRRVSRRLAGPSRRASPATGSHPLARCGTGTPAGTHRTRTRGRGHRRTWVCPRAVCRPRPTWRSGSLVPADALTTAEGDNTAGQLVGDDVQIRTLATPSMHAKLIVTVNQTVICSQNWSEPSMTNNREVGMALPTRSLHRQALQWFNRLWAAARPWH